MNLDINLARDPFRSYTLYYAITGLLGVVGIVVLGIELYALGSALSTRSRLVADVAAANASRDRDGAATNRLSAYVDATSLKLGAEEAEKVQELVYRRAFDWEGLFRELESVLPGKVKLTSIQPNVAEAATVVTLEGVAKSLTDLNDLVAKLEEAPGFSDVFVTSQRSDKGAIEFNVTAKYRGLAPKETS